MTTNVRVFARLILFAGICLFTGYSHAASSPKPPVAVIGTGDMGDSLGPRFAELGYPVVYGSRNPDSEKVLALVQKTGHGASAATQIEAAQAGKIVVLAVPWPAMETVAQSLGSLDGKLIIDFSMPSVQGEDGYMVSLVETSSAEMIQSWNPGATVVKAYATLGSFVIDEPQVMGGLVTVPIAADDRAAKEQVAAIVAAMGLDPVDAGPLRLAREIEALQRLYMVPLLQRRDEAWEPFFRRSQYWECMWQDDWSEPVSDADRLAAMPVVVNGPMSCPDD
ncbi:MAG: NADPH-dependent F420 reductase [Gammaproteobacteria bacterium]